MGTRRGDGDIWDLDPSEVCSLPGPVLSPGSPKCRDPMAWAALSHRGACTMQMFYFCAVEPAKRG